MLSEQFASLETAGAEVTEEADVAVVLHAVTGACAHQPAFGGDGVAAAPATPHHHRADVGLQALQPEQQRVPAHTQTHEDVRRILLGTH